MLPARSEMKNDKWKMENGKSVRDAEVVLFHFSIFHLPFVICHYLSFLSI